MPKVYLEEFAECEICGRSNREDNVLIHLSAFGMNKFISRKIEVKNTDVKVTMKENNPNYRRYKVCNSDAKLVYDIIKENNVEIEKAVMAAKIFRINNEIKRQWQ